MLSVIQRLTILGSILLVMACANTGMLEGISAHKSGNFDIALIKFRKAAEKGSAEGQFRLSGLYHLGEGVPQDYKQSAFWRHKAAEQGLAQAQYNLGLMYKQGTGVPQNLNQAATWLGRAATQGSTEAQTELKHFSMAEKEILYEAMNLCHFASAWTIDDLVSSTDILLPIVMSHCTSERDALVMTMVEDYSLEGIEEKKAWASRAAVPNVLNAFKFIRHKYSPDNDLRRLHHSNKPTYPIKNI